MSFIAILGAGSLGGALAHRLAARDRTREVRLIDPAAGVARGKALDILQSSPVHAFSTRLTSAEQLEAAAGAAAIVLADAAAGDAELAGEAGLATLRRLTAVESSAPLLFAGATQAELMARVVLELHVPRERVVGSAPVALASAVRALAGLELNASGAEVQLAVVGVPPRGAVIAWEGATAFGQPIGALVPPHRLAAISARLPALWPPGPLVLAAAACRVAEALVSGSRRRFCCFVQLPDARWRGAVAALPVELWPRGVRAVLTPALSRQEQTQFENALEGAGAGAS